MKEIIKEIARIDKELEKRDKSALSRYNKGEKVHLKQLAYLVKTRLARYPYYLRQLVVVFAKLYVAYYMVEIKYAFYLCDVIKFSSYLV